MSTEATDGRTDAVGAVEPDLTAAGSGPATATAGSREAGQEAAGESPEGVEKSEPDVAGEAPDSHESEASNEEDEPAEADETAGPEPEDPDLAEAEDPDEVAADYGDPRIDEGHGYDDAVEHDGDYEEYEEYGGYEPEEIAGPHRARRWPRALLALGFVVLAAAIVGGAIAIVGSVTHGFKKPVKVTYQKSALFSLKTGECFDSQGQSYTLIPCDSPHDAEVFATFALSGSRWPGAATVAKEASSGCASRLTGYLNPQLAISLSSTYIYPDSVAWQAGAKTVICEVRATSGQLTGSVRGASATAG